MRHSTSLTWLRVTAVLFLYCGAVSKVPAEEPSPDKVTKVAQQFLADLGNKKIDALLQIVSCPFYCGGPTVEKEEDVKKILNAMAKWYEENDGVAKYKILAVGRYKDVKQQKSSELGDDDKKKLGSFLKDDDWLVVVGKVVDGDVRPRLYLLVKEQNAKLSIAGAHK